MSTLSVSQLRQRLAACIAALPEWTESEAAFDRFRQTSENRRHKGFAVGCIESVPEDDRQVDGGVLVRTTLAIAFASIHVPNAQVTSYDTFLDLEAVLIARVCTALSLMDLDIRFDGTRDRILEGGFYYGELRFSALHTIELG